VEAPDEDSAAADRRELGLLTEQQLAAIAGVDVRTVQNWRTARTGPPFTRFGRTVVYHRESLLRWLKEREVETQP
jgi:phage terminase Nu1 subunit (DNA packaging protein)